ncbi:hypothetical protein MASR2M48_20070 [Spirochaetota bacterium]
MATGAKHKHLGVKGEEEFSGRGVSYCATCDGPFFKGKRMIVVGGGDAACDEAMFLSKLADKIIMITERITPCPESPGREGAVQSKDRDSIRFCRRRDKGNKVCRVGDYQESQDRRELR